MVLLREGARDWLLVIVVAILAIGANLPEWLTDALSIDRRYFLAGLIGVVGVALVRYLKFALLLVVVFLAVGANLPEEIASEFGFDRQIMLLGLVAMVVISLTNKIWKIPTGLDKSGRPPSVHGAAALFTAILKGRIGVVQTLLKQGVNVNCRTVTGKTPLMAAAYKGYGDLVQLLLDHGADPSLRDGQGRTVLEIAASLGHTRVAELVRAVGRGEQVVAAASGTNGG